MSHRPAASQRRQREFADDFACDFEHAPLQNTVHDTILDDDQLAQLCDATIETSIASDLRERALGESGEHVEDLTEMWGELDYIARQRALEVIAEVCASVIRDGEQWIEESHWDAELIREAQDEARQWIRWHTNETNRANVKEGHTMTDTADESNDIDTVVGTREYMGRVYSLQKAADAMNVDVFTGEHTHDIPTAAAIEQWIGDVNEESRHKAETTAWHTYTPHVALVAGSGEQLAESGALLSHTAFFHRDVTGEMDSHTAYNAAYKSDEYDVEYATDYEQGTVIITVEPVEEGNDQW